MCGKMRKETFVNQSELVLVSLYTWQDSKCDIIDKYNSNDVQKLKKMKCIPDFIKFEESNIVDEEMNDDNIWDIYFQWICLLILLMKKNLLIKK